MLPLSQIHKIQKNDKINMQRSSGKSKYLYDRNAKKCKNVMKTTPWKSIVFNGNPMYRKNAFLMQFHSPYLGAGVLATEKCFFLGAVRDPKYLGGAVFWGLHF